jgi:hypothetical protein
MQNERENLCGMDRKNQDLWNVTPYQLVKSYQSFE